MLIAERRSLSKQKGYVMHVTSTGISMASQDPIPCAKVVIFYVPHAGIAVNKKRRACEVCAVPATGITGDTVNIGQNRHLRIVALLPVEIAAQKDTVRMGCVAIAITFCDGLAKCARKPICTTKLKACAKTAINRRFLLEICAALVTSISAIMEVLQDLVGYSLVENDVRIVTRR